jgi:hypothetical protein
MVTTIYGPMDETTLEKREGVIDNEKCDTDGGHNSVGCFDCASYNMAIEAAERALSTDAGKGASVEDAKPPAGWIDATGAVEALCSATDTICVNGVTTVNVAAVMKRVPIEWAGSRVLIVRKP